MILSEIFWCRSWSCWLGWVLLGYIVIVQYYDYTSDYHPSDEEDDDDDDEKEENGSEKEKVEIGNLMVWV